MLRAPSAPVYPWRLPPTRRNTESLGVTPLLSGWRLVEDRDFGGQHGTDGNDARNPAIAVGQMRRDFQPARPPYVHAFDAIEEAADEGAPVEPDFGV